MLRAWAHSECLRGVRLCAQCLELPLCLCSLSWQGSVQLGDLAVDERTQRFFQLVEVPLQLPVVLLLILANQSLILPQGILTPAWQKQQESAQPFGSSFFFYELRVSHRVCHHLLVKSLKQRRSLLWWRNSFGSSGMSERKTCATSRGPCEGEKTCYLSVEECLPLLKHYSRPCSTNRMGFIFQRALHYSFWRSSHWDRLDLH